MATSGTTTFDLSIDDVIEEAYERCGMRATSGYQLTSGRRSLNILFLDWANRGLNLWTIEQATSSLTSNTSSFTLGTDTVNVLSAVIRDSSSGTDTDISIERISREEYLNVPNKSTKARPSQYYVERTNTPTVYLYPTTDKAYTFVYYRIRRIEEAGGYVNSMDVNFRFLPCITSGFARAAAEDRDTASVSFVPDLGS
jgi:hypothetical protein